MYHSNSFAVVSCFNGIFNKSTAFIRLTAVSGSVVLGQLGKSLHASIKLMHKISNYIQNCTITLS